MRKFAELSGMEYSHIQRIAAGKVNLALSSIISLAEGLDFNFAELAAYFDGVGKTEIKEFLKSEKTKS
jgi:hypothetical protein